MRAFAIITILAVTSGCQSYSSTILNRLDDNSFFGNSNGTPDHHDSARPYKGIPIALKVPTHLDVFVDEVYYMKLDLKKGTATDTAECGCHLYNIRTELIKTEKIFTVDFKRPGAGTLDLKMDFTDQQYFDKIVSNIQDETITQSAALAATVISSIRAVSASTATPETLQNFMAANDIIRAQRVVGYQRFDISAPDFEDQVETFVACYLNSCDPCGNNLSSTCPYGTCPQITPPTPVVAPQTTSPTGGEATATESFHGTLNFKIDNNPIKNDSDATIGNSFTGGVELNTTRQTPK